MTEKPKGNCPVCRRKIVLVRGGLLRSHGSKEQGVWPPETCAGAGEPPVEFE